MFGAFFDAKALQQAFSHDAYRIIEMNVDPRVGGGWNFAMCDQTTGVVLRSAARFVEIERPSRIVCLTRWFDGPLATAGEMRVTLEFSGIAGGTRLSLTHEFFSNGETRDHHARGWAASMDRLALLLEGALK